MLTISTASWLLRCSHKPSDANIRNWSSGRSFWTWIDGSALSIGVSKGSATLNLGNKGSLLNSHLLKYASPIDLEICKRISYQQCCIHENSDIFFNQTNYKDLISHLWNINKDLMTLTFSSSDDKQIMHQQKYLAGKKALIIMALITLVYLTNNDNSATCTEILNIMCHVLILLWRTISAGIT